MSVSRLPLERSIQTFHGVQVRSTVLNPPRVVNYMTPLQHQVVKYFTCIKPLTDHDNSDPHVQDLDTDTDSDVSESWSVISGEQSV